MDLQLRDERVLDDLSAIRKEIEDLANGAQHQAEAAREWRENQKWQVNDLRREVQSINKTVNFLLGAVVVTLIYIAYTIT